MLWPPVNRQAAGIRSPSCGTSSIEIKEEKIEGGLDKAMQGYQHFLEETPDSALKAEAIRRLADLKIAKEYGILAEWFRTSRKDAGNVCPGTRRSSEDLFGCRNTVRSETDASPGPR